MLVHLHKQVVKIRLIEFPMTVNSPKYLGLIYSFIGYSISPNHLHSSSNINMSRCVLFKIGHSRLIFLYFRFYNTVDSKQIFIKIFPMTGFEPLNSDAWSDPSTNPTEPQPLPVTSRCDCSILLFLLRY